MASQEQAPQQPIQEIGGQTFNPIKAANDDAEGGKGTSVTTLLESYTDKLKQSKIFAVDKKKLIELLGTKPVHELNPAHLAANINYIPELEKAAADNITKYTKKMADLNLKGKEEGGGLELVSTKAQKEYLDWLGEQPFEVREKTLKEPFYKTAERLKLLEDFKHVPKAERKACLKKVNEIDGLEEKQKFVDELRKRHETLKAAFFELPEAVQKNYKEKFRALKLADRAGLLKTLGKIVPDEGKKESETAERTKLTNDFRAQMKEQVQLRSPLGIPRFSPLSIPSNIAWLQSLTIDQQRSVVNEKKSDLFILMNERKEAVSTFEVWVAKLPPPQQTSYLWRFANADIDKRLLLLSEIKPLVQEKGKGTSKSGKRSYPPEIMEKTIQTALHDPHVQHQRLLLTMLDESLVLKKRAKVRYDAEHADVTMRKAEERGNEVDERQVLHIETLTNKAESRFSLKKFLRGKEEKGDVHAVANNMVLTNAGNDEVSIEEFEKHAVDHQREEAIAAIINLSVARLPGMDREQMRKNLAKRDLHVDLRDAIAA